MSEQAPGTDAFLALAGRLQHEEERLTSVQAGLLAAAHLGIAGNSRAFSKLFGMPHAVVLRELNALAGMDGDLVRITRRDAKSLRTFFEPGGPGRLRDGA